jgi:uncharacterized protein (TIGR02118 family)
VYVRLTRWQPRAGLDRAEALAAWKRHAELVGRVPGVRRYVQHHAVGSPDGDEPPYAGLGEVWFDDGEAARAALASPEWSAVLADADAFREPGSVAAAWAEPRVDASSRTPAPAGGISAQTGAKPGTNVTDTRALGR